MSPGESKLRWFILKFPAQLFPLVGSLLSVDVTLHANWLSCEQKLLSAKLTLVSVIYLNHPSVMLFF